MVTMEDQATTLVDLTTMVTMEDQDTTLVDLTTMVTMEGQDTTLAGPTTMATTDMVEVGTTLEAAQADMGDRGGTQGRRSTGKWSVPLSELWQLWWLQFWSLVEYVWQKEDTEECPSQICDIFCKYNA